MQVELESVEEVIVRSVQGAYMEDDRFCHGIGIRGLFMPGSDGNRVLVLMDGRPMNDNWIGSSYVDYDARTDIKNVDRLEVIWSPGSVLYGTNAFSGVINRMSRGRESPSSGSVGISGSGVARAWARTSVLIRQRMGSFMASTVFNQER